MAYERMFRNDTHAEGSVDRVIQENMIFLCPETRDYLYTAYTPTVPGYIDGTRPMLEVILHGIDMTGEHPLNVVDSIARYCAFVVDRCDTPEEALLFGGTEEQILSRGTYWCTDIARVGCVLCQIAGFPSRIVTAANTKFAYCGHTVIEAYYMGAWGVVDTTAGLAFLRGGRPACAWEIQLDPGIVDAAFAERFGEAWDFFPKGEQYRAVGIANYPVMNSGEYCYATSRLNEYGREVLRHAAVGWNGRPRWLFGEDR